MNKPIYCWMALWLAFLAWSPSQAQPLAELEKLAYSQNPLLKAVMLEYEAAQTLKDQASVWPGLALTATVPVLPIETRLGAQRFKVGVSQMFPSPGRQNAREASAGAEEGRRYEEARAAQLEISFGMRQAYFGLYELYEKQQVISRKLNIFRALERIALSRVEGGRADLSEVLRVQVKVKELEARLELLEAKKSGFQARINSLAGRPATTPVVVADSFGLAVIAIDPEALIEEIARVNPGLKQLDWLVESSEHAQEINRFDGRPTFGVGMEYALITPQKAAMPENNGRDVFMPMVMASIPLQRGRYKAKDREEELRQLALGERRNWMLEDFRAQVYRLFSEYREALVEAGLLDGQRTLTESAIDILLGAYSGGEGRIDEILRLETELLGFDLRRAELVSATQIIQAKMDRLTSPEAGSAP